jgi:hypothetical protein
VGTVDGFEGKSQNESPQTRESQRTRNIQKLIESCRGKGELEKTKLRVNCLRKKRFGTRFQHN